MILNLSNFIHSLLLENETVIIPGFGAFISTYKPAEISGNDIKPPSKEISFNQQIKNNDGLLVEIIARKAKISQGNAMKRVEKARENMLYELDNGETVILENIGSFSYNQNNEIVFSPFSEENLLLDSFGLESISKEDVVAKNDQHLQVAAFVDDKKIIDRNEPEPANQETTTGSSPEVKRENTNEPLKEVETVNETVSEKFDFPKFRPAPAVENEEKRKKIGWYWLLLLLIPILIGGYFFVTNYWKTGKTEYVQETKTEVQPVVKQSPEIAAMDSVQKDTAVANIAESPSKAVDAQVIKNETSKYYLIGGGFKEQENVDEFILQLKEKGIESFVAGKKGKLILVGIEAFDSEEDAMKSLNEHFKSNPAWKLWIFKKE